MFFLIDHFSIIYISKIAYKFIQYKLDIIRLLIFKVKKINTNLIHIRKYIALIALKIQDILEVNKHL